MANSWQQTPAGSHIVEREINGHVFQRAEIVDFWAMVFNPSTVHRLVHVWLGAFILGAFFVMSISAWYLLKDRHTEFARRSFTGGLLLGMLASLGQLVSGHFNSEMVAREQPAKLAAFEGHFHTGDRGTPLYLFGWPDQESQTVKAGVAIPGLLSFLVHRDFQKPVIGLDQLEADYGSPPVWLSFQSYHVMIGLGMLFIGSTLLAGWWWWRGTLFEKRYCCGISCLPWDWLSWRTNWGGSPPKWGGNRGSSIPPWMPRDRLAADSARPTACRRWSPANWYSVPSSCLDWSTPCCSPSGYFCLIGRSRRVPRPLKS